MKKIYRKCEKWLVSNFSGNLFTIRHSVFYFTFFLPKWLGIDAGFGFLFSLNINFMNEMQHLYL